MSDLDISLEDIRATLERAEDSIIFALLERSQWRRNETIYTDEFDSLLRDTEIAQAKAGRYMCPEETPFTSNTRYSEYSPDKSMDYRLDYYLSRKHIPIDYNESLRKYYFTNLLCQISEKGSDENPGSSVVSDIALLQAVSRRIHLGKVVAESKLRRNIPFSIQSRLGDAEILHQITDNMREQVVLERVYQKASQYLAIFRNTHQSHQLQPETIRVFFQDFIIPTTKQIQVDYLRPTIGISK